MNIIISGHTGYIGSLLTQKLKQQGHVLTGISRKPAAYASDGNINQLTADISSADFASLKTETDLFIHLAAANDVDSKQVATALSGTVLATRNALQFCVNNNIPNFLYFSTFQVYGEVEGHFNEERKPEPVNDYGITHLFAEEYVQMFARNGKLNTCILRPTNIYGAPVSRHINRWSLVPGCFCKEAVEKGSITLLSSGLQVRDFVDLNDLCDFTIFNFIENKNFNNATLNVASGNKYSILEIAEMTKAICEEELKKEIKLEVKGAEPRMTNNFSIERKKIIDSGFTFKGRESIEHAIRTTLSLLI